MVSEPLRRLQEALQELPGIGPRQALRIAYFISSLGKVRITELARAILRLTELRTCTQCFLTHEREGAFCAICGDETRDQLTVTIVERETDALSIEKAQIYRGRYLILGEVRRDSELSIEQKIRLNSLLSFLKERGGALEIIIAVNQTMYGELAAERIEEYAKSHTKKITRLGRGLPTGGEIEFADPDTLAHSLKNRR
ncbi:MAG: recombination protein RecR [Candidatus Harrisonbacteria bacterium]|nr:recombination protein RecR [Candidatus Harrisonbacteria bacterium]